MLGVVARRLDRAPSCSRLYRRKQRIMPDASGIENLRRRIKDPFFGGSRI
ncbi:hypothetical protein HMPREF0762_01227 [Slackia exigua ATCC 700122]|uniref:Uncharacterized protein n=1 Tax=Slackia exigua (strain ATCC 700122 / DSM 15923 / CIP 105133 / JCM 11022 / KCTC 5966 / S-7) TaxID=649764 RepID=D0WHI8_SLAES|nr:hypothetical protein HMPREF0762_01227 [Slackia exigua ATCC 700122]